MKTNYLKKKKKKDGTRTHTKELRLLQIDLIKKKEIYIYTSMYDLRLQN